LIIFKVFLHIYLIFRLMKIKILSKIKKGNKEEIY